MNMRSCKTDCSPSKKETNTEKAVHITLVSAKGIKKNKYADIAQSILTGDDLFT